MAPCLALTSQGTLSVKALRSLHVQGDVTPGFEAVWHAFIENFARRHEPGGACCVHYRSEKVVDIRGGVRNKETGEPWVRPP